MGFVVLTRVTGSQPVSFGPDCDKGVASLAERRGQQDLGQGGAFFEPDIYIYS